jgi:hypothetical protein
VDETGSGLPLPNDLDRLGPLVDLLFLDLQAYNPQLAAMLDVDTSAIHENPKCLSLTQALQVIARLFWIIIESHDKKRAAELKSLLNHAATCEHQAGATQRRRKTTFALDDRFSTLMLSQISGKHDIPEMKKQCEIVYMYIDQYPLPAKTRSEHGAMSVFQKWVNDHWCTLRERLMVVKCLCEYPPHGSGPPKLSPVRTTTPLARDKDPDPNPDPTEIKRGAKFKKHLGFTPHDITCDLLGHLHRLNPSTIGKLLKTASQ